MHFHFSIYDTEVVQVHIRIKDYFFNIKMLF